MNKLTAWFPASVKPVHPGVYECGGAFTAKWFKRWDGKRWYEGFTTVEGAATSGRIYDQVIRWRGLAEKPA